MKKILSLLSAAILTAMLCLTLTACGALSGTYSNGLETYTFSGDKYTYEFSVTIGGFTTTKTKEGTYKVEQTDDGKKIVFVTKDGDTTTENAYTLNEGKDDNGSYIEIGGSRYNKK